MTIAADSAPPLARPTATVTPPARDHRKHATQQHSPESAASHASASPGRKPTSPASALSASSSASSGSHSRDSGSGRSSGSNSAHSRPHSPHSSASVSSSPPSSGGGSSGSESNSSNSSYRGSSISPHDHPPCCDSPAPGSPVMASFSFAHQPFRSSGGTGSGFIRGLGWELLSLAPSSVPVHSRLIGARHEPLHEPVDAPGEATQFGSSSSQPVWRQLPSKMILPLQPTPRLRTHSSTLQSRLATTAPTPQRLSSADSIQHLLTPLKLDNDLSTPVLIRRKPLAATAPPTLTQEQHSPEHEREPKTETAASSATTNPATGRSGVSSICLRLPVPACFSPAMTRLYGLFNSWRLHTTEAHSRSMLLVASATALLLGFLVFEACLVLVACMLVLRGLQLTLTFHFHRAPHHRRPRSTRTASAPFTTEPAAASSSTPSESDTGSESNTPAMDELPLPGTDSRPFTSGPSILSDATVLTTMHQQASKLMALDALARPASTPTTESIEVHPIQQHQQRSNAETQATGDSDSRHPVLSHASFSSSSPLLADPLLRSVHPFFQGRAQLVGWLDHAIRNPLHAIIASADLMRSNSAEPEDAPESGSKLHASSSSSSLAESDLECLSAIVDAATNIQEIMMSLQQLAASCVDPDAGSILGSTHVSPTPPVATASVSPEISVEKESVRAQEEPKQLEVGEGSLVWPQASSSVAADASPQISPRAGTQAPKNFSQSNLVSPVASAVATREHSPRETGDAAARLFNDKLNMQLMSPHGSTSVPAGLARQPSAEVASSSTGSNMLPPAHNKSHSQSMVASTLSTSGVDFSASNAVGSTASSGTSGGSSWSFPSVISGVANASTPPLPIFNPLTNLRSQPSTPVVAKRRLTQRSEMTPPLTSPPATASDSEIAFEAQRPNPLTHVSSIREPPSSCASASPAQVTPLVVLSQVGVRTPPVTRATVEPEPSAQPSATPQQLDYRSCRVLVVDDSPINVKILSRMLTGLGLSVYTAADGLQAVEAVQKLAAVSTRASKARRKQRHTKRQQHLAATQAAAEAASAVAANSASHTAAASAPPVAPIMHAQEAMAQRSFSAHSPQPAAFLRVPHSAHVSSTSAGAQARGSSDDGSSSQSHTGSGSESVSPASSPAPSPSLLPSNSSAAAGGGGARKNPTWRAKRHFDIILSDVNMPLMNGLESSIKIREIEAAHGLPRVPIIAVTANSSLEDRAACADAGMNYFVQKPFVRNDIIVLVQQILQAQQQQQALEQTAQGAADSATHVMQPTPQTLAPLLPPLDTGAAHTNNMIVAAAAAAAAASAAAPSGESASTAPISGAVLLSDSLPAAPPRPLSGFDSSSPDLSFARCASDLTAERWIGSPSHVSMNSASLHSSSSAAAAALSESAASDFASSVSSSSSSSVISPLPCLPMSPLRLSPALAYKRYRTLGLKGGSNPPDA